MRAELKKHEAMALLRRLGAGQRLLMHATLVVEAGDLLAQCLVDLGVALDADFIRSGLILHDTGKIQVPGELDGVGDEHTAIGYDMLIREGVPRELARVCITHARWREAGSIEELVVACSDKVWKGKRVRELEEALVRAAAAEIGADFWELYSSLDAALEDIAGGGLERLERSRSRV